MTPSIEAIGQHKDSIYLASTSRRRQSAARHILPGFHFVIVDGGAEPNAAQTLATAIATAKIRNVMQEKGDKHRIIGADCFSRLPDGHGGFFGITKPTNDPWLTARGIFRYLAQLNQQGTPPQMEFSAGMSVYTPEQNITEYPGTFVLTFAAPVITWLAGDGFPSYVEMLQKLQIDPARVPGGIDHLALMLLGTTTAINGQPLRIEGNERDHQLRQTLGAFFLAVLTGFPYDDLNPEIKSWPLLNDTVGQVIYGARPQPAPQR